MEKIIDLYRKNRFIYNEFTNEMQELVTTLLIEKNIRVHSVVSRIKEETSLTNKIDKNLKKYTNIEDITDLCGIRIITYFEDDVDQIADIIQKTLVIDPINSVDKRKFLAANQFGYLSLHFVASLTTKQLQLPRNKKFVNCKIEIQIRSILQHAWAEIEHDLEYKSQTTISYDVRRRFSRLAGLLEIADIEFKKLRDDLQPSRLPVSKLVLAPVIPFSKKVAPRILPEKLIKKFACVRTLVPRIDECSEFTPLKKAVGYTFMSIILILLTTHVISISQFLSPIIASLKADKTFLFSLVSNHVFV